MTPSAAPRVPATRLKNKLALRPPCPPPRTRMPCVCPAGARSTAMIPSRRMFSAGRNRSGMDDNDVNTIPNMASILAAERAGAVVPAHYYFAFGSNMHLTQMAARCPGSTVFAKGTLRGYRWQINERGVANVVRSKAGEPSVVEGIVFTVTPKDIRTLDRNEGIAKQFYDKAYLPIQVVPLAIDSLFCRKTAVAARELERLRRQRPKDGQQSETAGQKDRKVVGEVEALVYLSSRYKRDGRIRREYIQRMDSAMADALKLGVDKAYLMTSLDPLVFVDEPEVVHPIPTPKVQPKSRIQPEPQPKIIERRPAPVKGNPQEQGSPSTDHSGPRIVERAPKPITSPVRALNAGRQSQGQQLEPIA